MKIKDFFSFGSIIQASAVGLKTDENGVSDYWNLIKGKYTGIDFPVIFKQVYGKI